MRTAFALALAVLPAACTSEAPTPTGSIEHWKSDATGFDTNTWWYDTGREVVVFDAQFTTAHATQVIAQIQATTDSPITWLVITHPNPDKFNGAAAFQALGARVIASAATAAAIPEVHAYKKAFFISTGGFTESTYPAQARVDLTFTGNHRLPLEAGEVVLEELAHGGVSTTQTIAKLPVIEAVIVGDLVHPDTHAWLEGGIHGGAPRPDLESWVAALDELRALDGWTVHPGRGPEAAVATAVPAQQAYLREMRNLVRTYVTSLADRSELTSDQAGVHWKAITERARAAFPDHALPYLIEYGVYGLALSL